MSITSIVFVLFIFLSLSFFYLVPKRFQWVVLLVSSIVFYVSYSTWGLFYVLITALTIYLSSKWMENISLKQKEYLADNKAVLTKEEKNEYKQKNKITRKRIMVVTLIVNFGILCLFKYFDFALHQINSVIGFFGLSPVNNTLNLVAPLGISFYTFQATGYLVDVYWGNCKAEKNFFKYLLFVSFFPQVTQGPISEYSQLSDELFSEHEFTYKNFSSGFQRLIWGYFKKMVIANMLAPCVNDMFANYSSYIGAACLVGAFAYSVQIYADFSGYMDIMCGACELFDIRLTENFERPYFSKSIAEYWRRWHISLGAWFKKYIYYPIGVSKWNQKLGKNVQNKFGKHFGQSLPASIALVAVWLTTGLWHGASWAYIAWGGVNGIIIIFSLWMEPIYSKLKKCLHINEKTFLWRAFQTIRTFVFVTFIKVLPEVGTLSDGIGFWRRIFTEHTMPSGLNDLFNWKDDNLSFLVLIFSMALLFVASLMQRKKPIRDYFNRLPLILRVVFLVFLILLILIFGIAANADGGFMYAKF